MYRLKFIKIAFLLLFGLFLSNNIVAQNNEMFKEKKSRKKMLRGWHRKRDAYNPYLGKSGKPTGAIRKETAKADKKALKKQAKQIKREKRKLRRQGKGYQKVKKA